MFVLPHIDFRIAAAIASLLLCATLIGSLLRTPSGIRETTLFSAWCWSAVSAVGLAAYALAAIVFSDPPVNEHLAAVRFAAAALTFCPIISVLGSKRPQHKAWNFIVLSLWAIVVLPALELALLQRGQGLEVNDARGWFLWLLILLTPVNYLPTRYWFASLAIAAGQVLLLSPHLPLLRTHYGLAGIHGISWITIGALSAFIVSRRKARGLGRFDVLWLDFRDAFGLLWSLRVQERVNAFLQQQEWPFELTWRGFRHGENDSPVTALPAERERMLRQTLSGLVRRFVSQEWIASRAGEDLN